MNYCCRGWNNLWECPAQILVAFQRMKSYLYGRSQCAVVDGVKSDPAILQHGVPQGSVLGPILFTAYLAPIGEITPKPQSGGTPLCWGLPALCVFSNQARTQWEVLHTPRSCVAEMRTWMASNRLRLNDSKTEFLTMSAPWHREAVEVSSLVLGSSGVACVLSARNLGVLMDQYFSMDDHMQRIYQAAIVQFVNIADIRCWVNLTLAETLIHAFVTYKLDCCNALLFGVSAASLQKLHRVQNLAARILTFTRETEHITPVLLIYSGYQWSIESSTS